MGLDFFDVDAEHAQQVRDFFQHAGVIIATGDEAVLMHRPAVGGRAADDRQAAVAGEFVEQADTTSGLGKTTQMAANVAGGIAAGLGFGGLRFGKTREYEFSAKPGNYEEGAAKAASLASTLLVTQLAGMR